MPHPCPHFAHFVPVFRGIWRYREMRVFPGNKRFRVADHVAAQNHDFFSGSGSSYVIGKAVNTTDED
jgi:hypothetical protein